MDNSDFEEIYIFSIFNFEEIYISNYNFLEEIYITGNYGMYFRRKIYDRLLDWKRTRADRYAVLVEGARRIGKSTVVRQFAENEYDSFIAIDFSSVSKEITACFDDVADLDMFFLRLQAATGITLTPHRSAVIFDEIQLFPKARQAIKHLVRDGRYHYIETGSLISIRKNVKDILIPSEEIKLPMFPMDYEEFLAAIGNESYATLRELYLKEVPAGQALNRRLMRDFRVYMAVGGMPQAVEAYADGRSFAEIDEIKRSIIALYEDDYKKIDPSGRISAMFHSIPAQLSRNVRRYSLTTAIGKQSRTRDEERLYDLVDSRTVLMCHNSADPRVRLSMTRDPNSYKLYLNDTGLFVTLMFIDRPAVENSLYAMMLSDRLPANLGYLYENAAAQIIASSGRELYYHTWDKPDSTHCYEIDFLLSDLAKVNALEVKSSGTGKHESLTQFRKRFSQHLGGAYVISQKDFARADGITYLPVYLLPFLAN